MNKGIKIVLLLLGVACVGAVGFCGFWVYQNAGRIGDLFAGTNLYTKQDVDNAYTDGYNTALGNKHEYEDLIAGYRDTITNLNGSLAEVTAQRDEAQNRLDTLIRQYNQEIGDLSSNYSRDVTLLQSQIEQLNHQIAALENNIAYYEDYIVTVESETRAVATFIVLDEVYDIQVLDKGTCVSVAEPVVDGCTFYGWLVDGELVDLDTYSVTQNTVLVADIRSMVRFNVRGEIVDTQLVPYGSHADLPSAVIPEVDGYRAAGWSLVNDSQRGEVVEADCVAITQDTNFYYLYLKQAYIELYDNDVLAQTIAVDSRDGYTLYVDHLESGGKRYDYDGCYLPLLESNASAIIRGGLKYTNDLNCLYRHTAERLGSIQFVNGRYYLGEGILSFFNGVSPLFNGDILGVLGYGTGGLGADVLYGYNRYSYYESWTVRDKNYVFTTSGNLGKINVCEGDCGSYLEIESNYDIYNEKLTFSHTTTFYRLVRTPCTVIFKVDGEEYAVVTCPKGTLVTPPADPVKDGFVFTGWDYFEELRPVEGDVEYNAEFREKTWHTVAGGFTDTGAAMNSSGEYYCGLDYCYSFTNAANGNPWRFKVTFEYACGNWPYEWGRFCSFTVTSDGAANWHNCGDFYSWSYSDTLHIKRLVPQVNLSNIRNVTFSDLEVYY